MNKFKALSVIALCLFCSCHHDDEPSEEDVPERTVLIYIAGENNLDKFASSDIKEMKDGSRDLQDRQKLIVYIDRAESTPPFFARIKDGKFVDSVSVNESVTANPAVLEYALQYMRTNYPAKSYGLVLWGHASGWLVSNDSIAYSKSRAYGGDTGNSSSGGSGKYWMNIPSMARAIANGMGGIPLRFVFGDCCSFGCVEVAYELRKVTDYVIGSPAEIPDEGAPYNLIVPRLFSEKDTFYKEIIDEYYQFYKKEIEAYPNKYYNLEHGDLKGYSVPLMAAKTAELENLCSATGRLLGTIHDKLTPTGSFDFSKSICYAMNGSNRYSYDMFQMLKSNTSSAEFNTWANAFNQAIPYSVKSNRWLTGYSQLGKDMQDYNYGENECGVVSMFIPRVIYNGTNPKWNVTIKNFQWNNVIRWEDYDW